MSGWTTNLILTGVVLVAGLGFGRQVLRWWSEDSSGESSGLPGGLVADGLGDPSREHQLQFGDQPWLLTRQSMAGPREAIAEALRARCGRLAQSGGMPEDAPSTAEEDFLRLLAGREPVQREAGVWEVYELDEGFPIAAGIRCQAAVGEAAAGADLAASARRVVTWGMAVPRDAQSWTLYTYTFQARRSGRPDAQSAAELASVPLPPQSRRTLRVEVSGGGAIIAFSGRQGRQPNGAAAPWQEPAPVGRWNSSRADELSRACDAGDADVDSWRRFYDRWFTRNGWVAAADWRPLGSVWYARFSKTGGETTASVDLRLAADDDGGISGLLMTK